MSILEAVPQITQALSLQQVQQLEKLPELFREWNGKINLVSRKDIEFFEEHHLLHSLLIAGCVRFPDRARILDLGTGGGLPGLPLAILFPAAQFYLLDSIGKKIRAVSDMIKRLELKNAQAVNKRAEKLTSKFDYVVGRSVATLPEFCGWVRHCLRTTLSFQAHNAPISSREESPYPPPGILYLKGSLYAQEIEKMGVSAWKVFALFALTHREYFVDKYLVYLRTVDLIPYFNKLDEQAKEAQCPVQTSVRQRR